MCAHSNWCRDEEKNKNKTDAVTVLASLLADIKTRLSTKLQQAVDVYQVGMKPKILYLKPLKKIFFVIVSLLGLHPRAYAGSQARGLIGAIATGLRQSHSNTRSELRLQPTPQLMATSHPEPTEWGQGLNPQPHGSKSDLFPLCHDGNSSNSWNWCLIPPLDGV